MIRGYRQRQHVKRELLADAVKLERRLLDLRQRLGLAERASKAKLDALSSTTPACPRCGTALVIRTARRPRYNGAQFWGCPHYESCGLGVVPLETYPRAAYAAAARKKARP